MTRTVFSRSRLAPMEIAIVGIDGSGKTTLAKGLSREFAREGLRVTIVNPPVFSESTGHHVQQARRAASALIERGARMERKTLTAAGSAVSLLAFGPAMVHARRKSDVVIVERHPHFEGPLGRAYLPAGLKWTAGVATRVLPFRSPDVVLHLRADARTAHERITRRANKTRKDLHETLPALETLARQYELEVAKRQKQGSRVLTLNANQQAPNVLKDALAALKPLRPPSQKRQINGF